MYACFAYAAFVHGSYPIVVWLLAMIVASIIVIWSARGLLANHSNNDPTNAAIALVSWAIVMRLVAAFTPAFFEDDYYRYLWDGYRTLVDGNAYLFAPAAFFDQAIDSPVMAEVLSHVNYPHIPTIYGPLLQNLFGFAAFVQLGALWPWKLLICSIDIVLIYFLIRQFGVAQAMLYAFSPLVVHEVAVAAHADGLIGALVLMAWGFAQSTRERRLYVAAICLGAAMAIKIHALLAMPFLLIALDCADKNMTARCKSAIFFVNMVMSVYAFFWLPYLSGFVNAWQSFFSFARDWQFNALAYAFINFLLPTVSREVALLCIAGLVLALMHWHWQSHDKKSRTLTAIVLAFAALITLSPVINSWYLLWLLPLACGTKYITPWIASMVFLLSYASDFNLGVVGAKPHNLSHWITVAEISTLMMASLFDVRQMRIDRNVMRVAK
jgi:alpha-1,6-mannosyltransferase